MNLNILFADDDTDDWEILQEAMQSVNAAAAIKYAENGEKALLMLDQDYISKSLPCLVVLDLNMPKLNGTQTLERIKNDERFKHIPVIIYSTSVNQLEKQKCLEFGASYYITKPVSLKESIETAKIFLCACENKTGSEPAFV